MSETKITKEVLLSKFAEKHFKKFLKNIDKNLIHLISEYTEIFSSESLAPSMLGPRLEVDRNQSVIHMKVKKQYKAQNTNKKTFVEKPFQESGYENDLNVKCWFYKDESENILGPFGTGEMDVFIHKGKIKAYSLVSFKNNEDFFPVMKMITEVNKKKNPDMFKHKGNYISYKGRLGKDSENLQKHPKEESKEHVENIGRIIEKTILQNIQHPETIPQKPIPKSYSPAKWFEDEDEKEKEDIDQEKEENHSEQEVEKIPETNKEEQHHGSHEEKPEQIITLETQEPIKIEKKDDHEILKELINENLKENNDFKLPSSSDSEEQEEWLQISSLNAKKKQKKKQLPNQQNVVGLAPKKPVVITEESKEKKLQISKEFNKAAAQNIPNIKKNLSDSLGKNEETKEIVDQKEEVSSEEDGWMETGNAKVPKNKKSSSTNELSQPKAIEKPTKSSSNLKQSSNANSEKINPEKEDEDSEWISAGGAAKDNKGKKGKKTK